MPSTMNTWIDALKDKATRLPDKLAFASLDEQGHMASQLTYAQLLERATLLARHIQSRCEPADRVLLLYGPGLEYVEAFYACMLAGVVAVPLYSPHNERKFELIQGIADDCVPTLALTTEPYAVRARKSLESASPAMRQLAWLSTDALPDRVGLAPWQPPATQPDDLAYLQYTSGSTSTPKGVMLSHRATLNHCKELAQLWETQEHSLLVSWLPHFHDLGQVFSVLQPVYQGMSSLLMAPASFMQKPLRWLKAISDFKATHSAAPDFAYMHCARSVSAAEIDGLDLSSWKVAVNGAEPVRMDSILAFDDQFAACGATLTMHRPSYGLAEATLVVSAHKSPWGPRIVWFDSQALSHNQIRPCLDTDEHALALVSNGVPAEGVEVAIVQPETRVRQGEDILGEIWIHGPSVGLGYWGRPAQSQQVFGAEMLEDLTHKRYLRTGDLGFFHEGELFIAGRAKDVIIIRGTNHYPQDIELTVEQAHPLIREGYTAAFSVTTDGVEKLIIAAERKRYFQGSVDYGVAMRAIQEAVSRRHGISAGEILVLKPGSISKTTSGKIQRRKCRDEFLSASLQILAQQHMAAAGVVLAERPKHTPVAQTGNTMQRVVQISVLGWLKDWLEREAQMDPASIEPASSLASHGLSSIDQFRLHTDLESFLQRDVPMEWLWEAQAMDTFAYSVAALSLKSSEAVRG